MNQNQLKNIFNHFNLEVPIKDPQRIHGGLLHTMWRVETQHQTYALKQLSTNITLNDQKIIDNYNLTEEIALRFKEHGIPAVSALKKSGEYLYITEGTGFMVYPWANAKVPGGDQALENHALMISTILARMHLINLNVPEILTSEYAIHTNNELIELANKAESFECSFAEDLKAKLQDLIIANDAYRAATPTLKNYMVVSHGDLDQKNVLWDEHDNPILIDWESARKINPTYEIVNASLDWSNITTNFNKELFHKMLLNYKKFGGKLDKLSFEASFYAVLGNWLDWMVHNIKRACKTEDPEQQSIGTEQVAMVLPIILKLWTLIPEIRKMEINYD